MDRTSKEIEVFVAELMRIIQGDWDWKEKRKAIRHLVNKAEEASKDLDEFRRRLGIGVR